MANSDPFDPDLLRLTGVNLDAARAGVPNKPPRHRRGEKFLCGPIPWNWLQLAARLRGSALPAALLVWFEAGCRQSRTFPLCLTRAAEFQLSPDTMRRGLRQLEAANLLSIHRPPGRGLRITILDGPAAPNAVDP